MIIDTNAIMRKIRSFTLLLLTLLAIASSEAQEVPLTRMLFVMDASNSMNATWESKPKINTAREILQSALTELEGQPNLEIGLRLYGHQTPIEPGKQDCDDTRLEVPFGKDGPRKIKEVLSRTRPQGTTPIARSLERAAGDFPDCRNCRNIIILITDGIEACDEDPCAVSRALQAKGIILKPFVIGIGLDGNAVGTFKCVGNYFDASTEKMFDHVLKVVITQALNSTSAQLNLLTADQRPLETNVPVTFYDERTGEIRYNFVHTLNHKGDPDTLNIDPIFTYRVVAHTIPPVVRNGVKITPGIHNIIGLDAGQGDLELKVGGARSSGSELVAVVHQANEESILHVQRLGTTERYLNGLYDLEVLTLPRLLIEDVKVSQSHTTSVQIPQSGVLNLTTNTSGYGAIFKTTGEDLEWVVDIDASSLQSQYTLLPGNYKVMYRSKNSKKTEYSLEKDVTITSGVSTSLKF